VIPDGAAEPARGAPTALERARTPALDALCAAGTLRRVATTPPGRAPGSETGIPVLLGARPGVAIPRGRLEAAAAGLAIPPGAGAWRVDFHERDGRRARAGAARAARDRLAGAMPDHDLHHLRGHRCLAIGAGPPPVPARVDGLAAHVWGATGRGSPGPHLDAGTVMVSGPGAAAGCARLLGAEAVRPDGATGGPDTDLAAKRGAALRAIVGGARRVVVHVGAPDEAAHERDADGKVAALEALDAELVGPLWDAVSARGGRLAVCPDHGTDPATGVHDGAPVPAVCAGEGIAADAPRGARMTERAAARRPVATGVWEGAA
jgi:2,3-bisphosphoglycerate-independent phosphoglycerate mutase